MVSVLILGRMAVIFLELAPSTGILSLGASLTGAAASQGIWIVVAIKSRGRQDKLH